jgi:GT2 family glycosyltransferase
MKSCAFLVLNWNGLKTRFNAIALLDLSLPSVIKAASRINGNGEVWLIDNCSDDPSVEYVQKKYPSVRIFKSDSNQYLFSYNKIVTQLDTDLVMFLNDDIILEEDSISPLIEAMEAKEFFGVSPDILTWTLNGKSNIPNSRCPRLHYHKGRIIPLDAGFIIEKNLPAPHYLMGGALLCDRLKFIQSGSFNPLFSPCYWEDADLCFMALSKGHLIKIVETSKVYHIGSASLKNDGANSSRLNQALVNQYCFMWKNLSSFRLLFETLFYIPYHAYKNRQQGILNYFISVMKTVLRLPVILKNRFEISRSSPILNDIRFFNLDLPPYALSFMQSFASLECNEPESALDRINDSFRQLPEGNNFSRTQIKIYSTQIFSKFFKSKYYQLILHFYETIDPGLKNMDLFYIVASSWRELGRLEKAEACYQLIIKESQTAKLKGLSYYHLAAIFWNSGRKNQVVSLLKKCLEIIPSHKKALELLSLVSTCNKNSNTATKV